jgi:hypothetical protein
MSVEEETTVKPASCSILSTLVGMRLVACSVLSTAQAAVRQVKWNATRANNGINWLAESVRCQQEVPCE